MMTLDRFVRSRLGLAITSIFALGLAPVPTHLQPPDFRFPSQDGARWTYSMDYDPPELRQVSIAKTTTDAKGARTIELAIKIGDGKPKPYRTLKVDGSGIYWIKDGLDEQIRILRFPVTVGAEWECIEKGKDRETQIHRFKIVELEELELPVGTIKAYRVEHKFGEGKSNERLWFADGLGIVKMHSSDTRRLEVLQKFERGR